MKRIAVYGSLRKGDYNYDRCIPEAELVTQTILQGWNMYDLGSYPCVSMGNGSIVIDIYDVTEDEYDRVEAMELGAGYSKVTIKGDRHGEATLFYMTNQRLAQYERFETLKKVESGDWISYKKDREAVKV